MVKTEDNEFNSLQKAFEEWIHNKYKEINQLKTFKKLEFLNQIDIEKDEIDKRIDEIINIAPPCLMEELVKYIAFKYQKDFLGKSCPYLIDINFKMDAIPNALHWLEVQINELKFFKKNDIIKPSSQCWYCGKPDSYKNLERNEIIYFKEETIYPQYCHSCKKLDKNNPNYENKTNPNHHKNCCYGKCKAETNALYQKLQALTEKTSDGKAKDYKEIDEEKAKIFIKFCEDRLKDNLNIKYTIQTKNQKAVHENDWIEYFNNK